MIALNGMALDLSTPYGRMIATVLAGTAEFERCPTCMVLFVIGADLQPQPDHMLDEALFNAAINANQEIKEWTLQTLEILRVRGAAERKAECAVAREWLIACGGSNLVDDLATLDAYSSSFDEKGFTNATHTVRLRASSILHQMSWGTRH